MQNALQSTAALLVLITVAHVPCRVDADEIPRRTDDRPNFIVFFTDDQGYNDVGCYGAPLIETPHFDQMACEGTRFTSFYAQNVCGPSRAALLTGCYPIRCGEPANHKNPHTVLHPQEWTLAEVLQRAGYATACIGKWHVAGNGNIRGSDDGTFTYATLQPPVGEGPFLPELMPNAQGFDYFLGTPMHNGTTRQPHPPQEYVTQLRRNGEVVEPNVDLNTLTKRYTEESIRFLRANKDRPFFLYLAHTMPHVALGVSERFRGRSQRGLYGDVVMELDWSLGQIVTVLQEIGVDDRTLILFTSDNGPWIEEHLAGDSPDDNHFGSACPLRGSKMMTWEGGLRVPGIIRWPGRVPAGRVSDEIVTTMDLLPTFAALAGAELPTDRQFDGIDMSDFFLGRSSNSGRSEFIYYAYTHLQAVRQNRWKLVLPRPANPAWTVWYGRMIDAVEQPQLYDLHCDLSECRDVAAEHPEIVESLMKRVAQVRNDLGDFDRIGRQARFFDPAVHRPDMHLWEP